MNINTWLGCGRLTKDADFNVTQKGTSMAKFRMAVNDRRNDDTLYLNVLCFGKMAEALQAHLTVAAFRIFDWLPGRGIKTLVFESAGHQGVVKQVGLGQGLLFGAGVLHDQLLSGG